MHQIKHLAFPSTICILTVILAVICGRHLWRVFEIAGMNSHLSFMFVMVFCGALGWYGGSAAAALFLRGFGLVNKEPRAKARDKKR